MCKLQHIIALMGSLASIAAVSVAQADPYADKTITSEVQATIAAHADLGVMLYGHAKNGVVYLSGFVPDLFAKENAEELAKNISGVKEVVDNAGISR